MVEGALQEGFYIFRSVDCDFRGIYLEKGDIWLVEEGLRVPPQGGYPVDGTMDFCHMAIEGLEFEAYVATSFVRADISVFMEVEVLDRGGRIPSEWSMFVRVPQGRRGGIEGGYWVAAGFGYLLMVLLEVHVYHVQAVATFQANEEATMRVVKDKLRSRIAWA